MVTRRLIALAGDGVRPSRSRVPVLERCRELLEQAFDNDMAIFQKNILLVLIRLIPQLHDCLLF